VSTIYATIHREFGIDRIELLPVSRLDDVLRMLDKMRLMAAMAFQRAERICLGGFDCLFRAPENVKVMMVWSA
jgi:sulfopyruvate decarboxylase TPP-binding subunit